MKQIKKISLIFVLLFAMVGLSGCVVQKLPMNTTNLTIG